MKQVISTLPDLPRRETLRFMGHAGLVLPFLVNGVTTMLSPARAGTLALPFQVLSTGQARTLEALGDTLLPGAAMAGVAYFVDAQLAAPVDDCMLMLRYLPVAQPASAFYREGLDALDNYALAKNASRFAACSPTKRSEMVAPMLGGPMDGWAGPAAALFYLAVRSDAVDVVYGGPKGTASLGLPYMEHLLPPRAW